MAKALRGGKYSGQVAPVIEEPKVAETQQPKTKYNEQGFEVEDSNSPDMEFSDTMWEKMAELRSYGVFQDSELRSRVDDKISQLVDEYGDLERYDADLTNTIERLESSSNITDDEYWAAYHFMADSLGIKPNRYTVMDSDGGVWDERYSSLEQAETWAAEQEDAKYIYDTWTRKMKKLDGKNWRNA